MKKPWLLTAIVLLLMPAGSAQLVGTETFTEDFEDFVLGGFFPERKPFADWYRYTEASDVGEVTDSLPVISGSQSFRATGPAGGSGSGLRAQFDLVDPASVSSIAFTMRGLTIADNGVGSAQYVSLESGSPRRTLVQFYVLCDDPDFPAACALNVRFNEADTQGQQLVPYTTGAREFVVLMVPDWLNGIYNLQVNGVDDGVFPFLHLPLTFGRIEIGRAAVTHPMGLVFDDWTITGAFPADPDAAADAAGGIKNFLTDINFTTPGSLFIFGLILLIIFIGAVMTPAHAVSRDNTITPALGLFIVLSVLWLVSMEIWPSWIGIVLIILTSALISLVIRRLFLGISNAASGPGLVAGSMGYFIIASTFLAMSGYAGTAIELPGNTDVDIDDDQDEPTGGDVQFTFAQQVTNCVLSLFTKCKRDSPKATLYRWGENVIDSVAKVTAQIFSYGRAAAFYLFQLLSFQLPIPVVFNMMIVFPPAAALATLAIQTIRGVG